LLSGPLRGRMSGDAKMQNTPPVVRQYQEQRAGPGTEWLEP
jgi:hypothetical protein